MIFLFLGLQEEVCIIGLIICICNCVEKNNDQCKDVKVIRFFNVKRKEKSIDFLLNIYCNNVRYQYLKDNE